MRGIRTWDGHPSALQELLLGFLPDRGAFSVSPGFADKGKTLSRHEACRAASLITICTKERRREVYKSCLTEWDYTSQPIHCTEMCMLQKRYARVRPFEFSHPLTYTLAAVLRAIGSQRPTSHIAGMF